MASVGGGIIRKYEFTQAWGVNPSSARGDVVIADAASFTLEEGDYVVYQFDVLATFYGVVSEVVGVEAEGSGTIVSFTVLDNRVRLQWQVVTGAWNMLDQRPSTTLARPDAGSTNTGSDSGGPTGTDDVEFGGAAPNLPGASGVGALSVPSEPNLGRRRYAHLLPENAAAGIWTYTDAPLSAQEILNSAFRGAWGAFTFSRSYAASMGSVYPQGIDASSGVKLGNLVAQITSATGLDVRISGKNTLHWERKGSGLPLVVPTTNTEPRRIGTSLTANDTAVMVTGDANIVQVLNVELEPDWASAWEAFIDEAAWIREVVEVFSLATDTKADRAEAAARAREVTVAQYVAATEDASFIDWRPLGKVSRMMVPAWHYIRELVFRSYRIPADYEWGGIPLESLRVAQNLLSGTEITGTGASAKQRYRRDNLSWYPSSRVEVIAKGQPLDLIDGRSIELFMARRVKNLREEWTTQNAFEVDEENRSIRFSTPLFIDGDPEADEALYSYVNQGQAGGADVTESVEEDSDYLDVVVPNPNVVILPAEVRMSVAWELGRYRSKHGQGARHGVLSVPGLALHLLDVAGDAGFTNAALEAVADNPAFLPDQTGISLKELTFASGDVAAEAAERAAETITELDEVQVYGSYTLKGSSGTTLSPVIDRVSLVVDGDGVNETVELTKARASSALFAERTLNRLQRSEELFNGQDALRREVEGLKIEARLAREALAAKRSKTHETVDDVKRVPIGSEIQATMPYIVDTSDFEEGFEWNIGDVVWLNLEGRPAPDGSRFGGVIVSEPGVSGAGAGSGGGSGVLNCATDGVVPVRCAGGISDVVYGVIGQGSAVSVGDVVIGRLEHAEPTPALEEGEVLAMVRLNTGGGGETKCGFQYIRAIGEGSSGDGWEIVGGSLAAGPQTWGVDAHEIDTATDGTFRYYLEFNITANTNDGVIWPGIESSTEPEWKRVASGDGYPDTETPTNTTPTVTVRVPMLKIKIAGGVPTILQREGPCQPVLVDHCLGRVIFYGTPTLITPAVSADDSGSA